MEKAGASPPLLDSDADLVARLKAGEDRAFETLLRVHGPRMLAVARRYLSQEADAQDALQDAFMNVVRGIHSFAGEAKLSTWLHRVVANAALMRIRSRRRRPEEPTDPPVLLGITDRRSAEKPHGLGVSAVLGDPDLRQRVRDCVDRLPEAYRTVLRLRDIEGTDMEEIGRLLGLTRPTVKIRLHRGRHALRAMLSAEFEGTQR